MSKIRISLNVNGKMYEIEVQPHWTLLHVIRNELGLTGTKEGCARGECAACTVIMDGKSVPACLVPAVRGEGKKIKTIEALQDGKKLHPVQQAFVENGAVQCGFCTPGMVMTSIAYLEQNPKPSETEVREALKGNLCRCTGYAKYVESIMGLVNKGASASKEEEALVKSEKSGGH